jgi:hypothetical protein
MAQFLTDQVLSAAVREVRKDSGNVAVTNIRQNHMHKVIIVKAKPFPHNTNNGWSNAYPWTKVKRELQYYTEKACCNFCEHADYVWNSCCWGYGLSLRNEIAKQP